MKKLLYIIIILPLFGFGQLVSSGGALLSNPYSYPVDNCVQALTTATATELIDVVNGINPEKINANCFVNNNTDNIIRLSGVAVPSNNGWAFGCIFNPRVGSLQYFGYSERCMSITSDKLKFRNNTSSFFDSGVLINEDRDYILFTRYGLDGTQKYFEVWLDNVYKGRTNITTDSYRFLYLNMSSNGPSSVKKIACIFYYDCTTITDDQALNWNGNKINGGANELLIPFVQGSGTTVSDVNNDVDYTIDGTIDAASWDTQSEYFYANNEGFSYDGLTVIPASQLNSGYDTDGNILTNPAIENGLNGGCDIVYPNNATLEALDTDNFLYTVGGTPIELSISDLQANWNNQFFWNTDNSTYAKQGLIYSVPVPTNPIDKYYDGKRYLIKF